MRRVRRPLLALLILILALAIGYSVRALRSDGHGGAPDTRSPSVSVSQSG